jgi:hypothetical protein
MDAAEIAELATEAAALLQQRHGALLRAGERIRVRLEPQARPPRVELALEDAAADNRVELSVQLLDLAGRTALELGLDFLDGVLAEHLASGREAMPRLEPAPAEFEGHRLALCGRLRRPALEAAADALLQER